MNGPGTITFAFVLLAAGCAREATVTDGSTIAPAAARPDTAGAALSTVGSERVLSTAGSPLPPEGRTATVEPVWLRDEEIRVRPLLPQMQTAFRVINDGTRPHALRIVGPAGTPQVAAALEPGRELVLQMVLGTGQYTLSCAVSGHSERAGFMTYSPGSPLDPQR